MMDNDKENLWIKEPIKKGWWWCLSMGYAQEISCNPIHVNMIKGKPCVLKEKKSGIGHKWVSIKKEYANDSGHEVLGWQENPEPYFNPNDY